MTISSTPRRAGPYNGNDATTQFPFTFKVFKKEDIRVVLAAPDGTESALTLDSDYSVSLNGSQDLNPGGTITYPLFGGPPLPTGWRLTVVGSLAYTQPTDIQNSGGFYPQVAEDMGDRSVILSQQLLEVTARALVLSVSSNPASTTIPDERVRARKALIFDDNGNVTVGTDDYEDQAENAAESARQAAESATQAGAARDEAQRIADEFGDLESAVDRAETAADSAEADAALAQAAADSAEAFSGAVHYLTLAGLQEDTSPAGTVGVVMNDPNPANNGYYITNGSIWTRTELQPASASEVAVLKAQDSRTINRGKSYPYLRKVRGGIDLDARQEFLDSILDIKFYGIDPDYYYFLSVMQNGNDSGGNNAQGFRVERAAIATYESSGTSQILHNITSTVGLGLDYAIGGVQRCVVRLDAGDGVFMEVLVDVDSLPPYGTSFGSSTPTSFGYNWINDPACYRDYPYPSDYAGLLKDIDSRTINSGKFYPFLRKVRAGVDFGPRQKFVDAILDIAFYGTAPDFYYYLNVMQNGRPDWSPSGQGFRVERAPVATFETTGASTVLHDYVSAVGLGLDYAVGGVQRRVVKLDSGDIYMDITVDLDKLPPYGTAIAAVNSTSLGYNWVNDPACYHAYPYPGDQQQVLAGIDALTVNRGRRYPCEVVLRNASAPLNTHPYLDASLLEAEVIDARPDYFYRLSFIGNGSNAGGQNPNYGISVTRIPADRLDEGYEQNIVTYNNLDVRLIPDRVKGGIQEFIIPCVLDQPTKLRLVFDVDAMPPDGTAIGMSSTNNNGYNARILPSRYIYPDQLVWKDSEILVEYIAAETKLKVSYKSGTKWYQMYLAKKTVNNTFSPLGFGVADAYSSLGDIIPVQFADWTRVIEGFSDYHSPVSFNAANNSDIVVQRIASESSETPGDPIVVFKDGNQIATGTVNPTKGWSVGVNGLANLGDILQVQIGGKPLEDYTVELPREQQYTSGAHGTDEMSGGDPTAQQKELIIYVDDTKIDLTKDLKVRARNVTCVGAIDVYASNTFRQQRFALRQNYTYSVSAGWLMITDENVALEDILMLGDNGPQAYMAGLTPINTNTYLFWGGNMTERKPLPEAVFHSGAKSLYPRTLGVSIRHPISGEFSTWVDLDYGVGDRRYVIETRPLFEHSNTTGSKIYPRLFNNATSFPGVPFAAGESYKWRGGYYWGQPTITAEHDTVVKTSMGIALVKPDGKYVALPGPNQSAF